MKSKKFMEKHLMDKNLLNDEWKDICEYEADPDSCEVGKSAQNKSKNRSQDSIPCKNNEYRFIIGVSAKYREGIIQELTQRGFTDYFVITLELIEMIKKHIQYEPYWLTRTG